MPDMPPTSSPPASAGQRLGLSAGSARGKRGPKPLGERSMTGAERQRKYREGLKDDVLFEHLSQLNAVALREKLFDALTQLEKFRTGRAKLDKLEDIRDDLVEGALYAAEKSWQEVGRRYGFKNAKKTSRVTE